MREGSIVINVSIQPSRWRLGLSVVASAALMLAVTSCSSGSTEAGSAVATAPVRIAVASPIESLSPDQSFLLVEYGMAELLARPAPDGTVTGWLAQSIIPSEDLKTWSITLNSGVTFHNGSPVDGKAVAAALQRTIAQQQRYFLGATVEATGELEVTIVLPQPNSTVRNILASRYNFPIYDANALPADLTDAKAIAAAGVYTGPFIPDPPTTAGLTARANPDYWQGEVEVGGLQLQFVEDPQARVAAVEAGEVYIAMQAPAEAALTIAKRDEVVFVTAQTGPLARVLLPHVTTPPLDDPLVRRAISYAIDYQALADEVLAGAYEPASGLYSSGISYGKQNYAHDPGRAAALLDDAGWRPDGGLRTKGGQPLALRYIFEQADLDSEAIGIGLKAMLANVGIDLELQAIESFYAPEAFPAVWHLALRSAQTQGVDNSPVEGIDYLLGETYGIGEVNDPDVQRFVNSYLGTVDEAEHARLLGELQDVVLDRGLAFVVGFEYPKVVTTRQWATFKPTYSAPVIWYDIAPA
ncbi:MAG: ABC transporter substrate-binding protein [Egibacteraceae bacterium]